MASIRCEITLASDSWKTLYNVDRDTRNGEPMLRMPRVMHECVMDAIADMRTSGIPAHRLHSVRIVRYITTSQARNILGYADTMHESGLTYTWDERESARAFADTVAIAHGMDLTVTK